MSHDLIAELEGYRAELAGYVRGNRPERAKAVREEMAKVVKAIGVEADKLIAQAQNHEEEGRDIPAAQARVEARRLRRPLADLAPAEETAADTTPRETATTKKKGA